MSTRHRLLALGTAALLAGACSDNPAGLDEHDDGHDDQLIVTLTLSEDHLHTLNAITFEVSVVDGHGDVVTDFESLEVEYLREDGGNTWRGIDMVLHTNHFEGEHTFGSSGEYHLRVSALRHGETVPEVIYEAPDHYEVARAHFEVGHVRIEFESFPGHMHEGEEATLRFWVLEEGAPIVGLDSEIQCEESGGAVENHPGTEIEPGVYEAVHTFGEAGEFHAGIEFLDHHGETVSGDFHMHISHGH